MTFLKISLLSLFLLPSLSWASLGLPPAEELMTKASQGRTELREVILDMDNNIQEMGYPEVFDSYFYLLDDLKELAILFNLDEIYPGAVEELGTHMVDSGIRWLNISEAKTDRILYYHKWMNVDVTIRYMDQVEVEIGALKNMDKVKDASENVEVILSYVEARFPRYYHLKAGYRRILSNIALKFLREPGHTNEDIAHWIGKLRSPAAYMDYLILLSGEIYSLKDDSKDMAHVYANRLKVLYETIQNDGSEVPESVQKNIGEAAEDLILRILRLEVAFNAGELRSLLDLLSVGQLHDLANQWDSFKQMPSDLYIQNYFDASRDFVAKLREIGMAKEVADINSWVGAMGAPAMARLLGIEGRYELTDGKGTKWQLLIVKAREMQLEALMWKSAETQGKLYQTIRWDFEKSTFVASERMMDLTDFAAPSLVKFKPVAGAMEFFDPFANADTQNMSGPLVEKFTDLMKDVKDTVNFEGYYKGSVTFADGKEIAVQLTVSALGGHYMGRIMGEGIETSFEVGSQTDSGVLYLTSSRDGTLKEFSHLRVKLDGPDVKGSLITADRGTGILKFVK
ncbi:hypothetical protein [Bdellovibrio bacteriovorus]|uniref:hypothetical protein n=1 Tax=Bdellovibrio TaxID=958 RepID=UPI0035A91AFD